MNHPSCWDETESPNETYVYDNVKNTEFYICLCKDYNTDRDNEVLRFLLAENIEKFTKTKTRYITYESIRNIGGWREASDRILMDEVASHKPYGSFRGFSTFVFAPLYKRYIIRVITEIWAQNKIATLAGIWIERHLRPGGGGYKKTKKQWEERRIQQSR